MALLPTRQRDQIMVGVCVAALAVLGLYYQYVWSPKQDSLNAIEAHTATLDSLNHDVKLQVARGSVAQLKRQADGYARDLEILRHLVPTENEVPALLEAVSTASRRVGLEVSEVTPEGVMPGDQFDTYKYKLGVTGPYHAIAEFLTNVGSLQRIVAPINLSLTASSRNDVRRQKNEANLEAKFEIQTYVAHASAPVRVPAAPAGAQ